MPSQTAFDFSAPGAEERARVWIWCAYLMGVESDAAQETDDIDHGEGCPRRYHAEARCTCPETWARVDELTEAGNRFYAKASEVAGRELTDEDWQRAIEALGEST